MVAINLGYSIVAIACCVLGAVCIIKAAALKDLKDCENAPKLFLIAVWTLYAMFLTMQIVISAWIWVTYPIIMTVAALAFLCIYIYVMRKNNSE